MFQPFDKPLPFELIFNFNPLTNLCHGNLKIIENVSVIEPWAEWVSVLFMKSKFDFRRFVPS